MKEREREKVAGNTFQTLKVDFLGGKVREAWQIIVFEVYVDSYSIPN